MDPKSRAHRILKQLRRYHAAEGDAAYVPSWVAGYQLAAGEWLLGVYENRPGEAKNAIVVTDQALHVRRPAGWERLDYQRIAGVVTPNRKEEVAGLDLRLRDGTTTWLPVEGGDEKFRDAFEVMRFITRVLGDLQPK